MIGLLHFLGVDRAIAYTLIGRGWAMIAGLVTLAMVSKFLSPVDQGYYYTFASILALQIFFDLGLSFVVLQTASHEKSKLKWTQAGVLAGDPVATSRLYSLVRFSLIWYGAAALLIVVIVTPAGLYFFSNHNQSSGGPEHWQLAWAWLVAATALNLILSPIFSLLEGCELVADVALVWVGRSLAGSLLMWIALFRGWGLMAIPLLSSVGFLWSIVWLVVTKRQFLLEAISSKAPSAKIRWWDEIWPFQWRIALSWLSGYFIFQLFTPVLFAYQGAVIAGQMGMSIAIANALLSIALAWVTTKAPTFGILVATKSYSELDRVFSKCLWQSLALMIVGGAAIWGADFFMHSMHYKLASRLLEPLPFGILIATTVVSHIVASEAAYLRAHKHEPFLGVSLLNGCLIGISTYILGRYSGVLEMMSGYLIISLTAGLGLGTWVFMTKRRTWHKGISEGVALIPDPKKFIVPGYSE